MKPLAKVFSILLLIAGLTGVCHADLIGTIDHAGFGRGQSVGADAQPLSSIYITPFFAPLDQTAEYSPFGTIEFSAASVGQQYVIDSGSAFLFAVALLTNGIDDYTGFHECDSTICFFGGMDVLRPESWDLRGPDGNLLNHDYLGSQITSMRLTILEFSSFVEDLGTNLNLQTSADYKVEFFGTTASVPEPSTILLLGAGIAGLPFLRRRRES